MWHDKTKLKNVSNDDFIFTRSHLEKNFVALWTLKLNSQSSRLDAICVFFYKSILFMDTNNFIMVGLTQLFQSGFFLIEKQFDFAYFTKFWVLWNYFDTICFLYFFTQPAQETDNLWLSYLSWLTVTVHKFVKFTVSAIHQSFAMMMVIVITK